jgi:hypothetical protein
LLVSIFFGVSIQVDQTKISVVIHFVTGG